MMDNVCDILALSPHPDDVEIACGGSIILARQQGLSVVIADLTDGELASRGTVEQRRIEAREAAHRLGVNTRRQLGFADMSVGPSDDQTAALASLIRELRPRLLLVPSAIDRHPDHEASARLARRAAFLARLVRHGSGPAHQVEQIVHYAIHQPETPSFVIDVSAVWEKRMHALAAYESQFGGTTGVATALSGGDFLRFIEARAICLGALVGARYGEGFIMEGPPGLAGFGSIIATRSSPYRNFL